MPVEIFKYCLQVGSRSKEMTGKVLKSDLPPSGKLLQLKNTIHD